MTGAATVAPQGRVILISGANRGIGLAIARRLHGDGYCVSLGARDVAALDRATADFDPARTSRAAFDALKPADAAPWVAATAARFGRIDGLVNNAGILRVVNFEQGDEADLDALWNVNAKAAFRLIRLCLPHLKRSGQGRIVNIASTDGKRVRDASVSVGYAMAKHALLALSHAAKFAGWDAGVRVTALCPGAVDTELIAGIPGVMPAASRIDPATVAAAVAFVLSLPNNASVAELAINGRLESTL
jgi:NAD(P)-dependent dehydrogenase (short-subunit alcohol dehydrogenase family)